MKKIKREENLIIGIGAIILAYSMYIWWTSLIVFIVGAINIIIWAIKVGKSNH